METVMLQVVEREVKKPMDTTMRDSTTYPSKALTNEQLRQLMQVVDAIRLNGYKERL
ncbi:hypothetical protein [Lysinibacillus piscis]|uniref:Uncharacterized protein n=1 Tax=Lysinibacillus piscis TaxID=2518931 RepID=A0ABQ5NLJ4_9BACI|nr:hypothetical protein [Lysinibacillus sp. KH24]GLC88956.1 hypothetical protein LYSBPC_20830 [Lysinibacillus sp. KH24]